VEEIDTDADLLARYGLKKPRPWFLEDKM
jgi:hypothetical protein